MTVEELRVVDEFLDEAASYGMTLEGARQWCSARIFGGEIHERHPALSVDEVAMTVGRFCNLEALR